MEQRYKADWWGRIMGLLGLIAGTAAIGYAYNRTQPGAADAAGGQQQLLDRFSVELEKQRQEVTGSLTDQSRKFNTEWNQQLTQALAQFRQDARNAVDAEGQAQAQRSADFQRALNALTAPRLRISSVAYRPVGDQAALVVIQNDGGDDASIQQVSFQPQSEFQVSAGSTPQEPNVQSPFEVMQIEFDSTHNRSSQAGRHGLYVRQFDEPPVVPGHSSIALKFVIRNDAHVGWGLEGLATIDYGDQKQLELPTARAYFIPAPTQQ
jgi:hypothetical protein